jgi:hypothetical protein
MAEPKGRWRTLKNAAAEAANVASLMPRSKMNQIMVV